MYYGLYFSSKFSATDSLSFLLIGIVIILVKAFFYSCKSFTFSADRRPFKPKAVIIIMNF